MSAISSIIVTFSGGNVLTFEICSGGYPEQWHSFSMFFVDEELVFASSGVVRRDLTLGPNVTKIQEHFSFLRENIDLEAAIINEIHISGMLCGKQDPARWPVVPIGFGIIEQLKKRTDHLHLEGENTIIQFLQAYSLSSTRWSNAT